MLRLMFNKMHPGENLIEQNDWTLGEWMGGPISKDDFFSKTHRYVKNLDVVLLPSKQEYSIVSTKKVNHHR